MKQILENRFKALFLLFLYTDNEMMMDKMQELSEAKISRKQLNEMAFSALRETLYKDEPTDWFLKDIAKDETALRWGVLFTVACENDNDTFTDMLEALQVKLNEKHPNAKDMLTYMESMAVNIFELKEDLPAYQLN